jgi:hypothetical protein
VSRIHYFQRYSTVENTVTNNTLQLLARIYNYSASRASTFLTDLTGESIEIGIEINQQGRTGGSVPDGTVLQRSFKVLIEAKVDSPVDDDQLARHAESFSNENQKILILLTKQALVKDEQERIVRKLAEGSPDVIFKNVTYEGVCNATKGLFKDYESDMAALVDDYVEYCNDVGLFDQSKYLMRILPCGKSVEINKRHGVYFHPSDRGYTKHAFVGIYANKVVQCLWALDCVFDVELDGTILKKTLVEGRDTTEYDKHLAAIINEAERECGYDIKSGNRFFCGKPEETDYRKMSAGGIQGARFVNLRDELGQFSDAADVAKKLRSKQWK